MNDSQTRTLRNLKLLFVAAITLSVLGVIAILSAIWIPPLYALGAGFSLLFLGSALGIKGFMDVNSEYQKLTNH